ncbi:hypothetical protein C8J57DRAFT_1490665 [Mycena rebaudengoi]|nr:hypothetical protein C8J57DRAFT_1490665 [Mycena rebaudengoi]
MLLPDTDVHAEETRIRWVQATTTFERIREIVNSNVEAAEEKLRRVIEIVMGEGDKAKAAAKKGKENRFFLTFVETGRYVHVVMAQATPWSTCGLHY